MSDTNIEKLDLEDVHSDFGFTRIIFQNIAPFYPEDAAIECTYNVSPEYEPTSRDWVGLYKVGWMSPREYLYYEWSPATTANQQAKIIFPAHNLPDDDGEFYQFCYVSRGEEVLGASIPFQFKKPSADDFVEIEETGDDMMVVYSKTQYLQKRLDQAEEDEHNLVKKIADLEVQLNQMTEESRVIEAQLFANDTEKSELMMVKKKLEQTIEDLSVDAANMAIVHDELQLKIEEMEGVKREQEQNLVVLEEKWKQAELMLVKESESHKQALLKLQAERDEMNGRLMMMNQQLDMYKDEIAQAESVTNALHNALEKLQSKEGVVNDLLQEQEEYAILLREKELEVAAIRVEVVELKQKLHDAECRVEKQQNVTQQEKINVEQLQEKLRNAEDKLAAAEDSKRLMEQEMESYRQAQQNLSMEVEKTKSENHILKLNLEKTEKGLKGEIELLKSENSRAQIEVENLKTLHKEALDEVKASRDEKANLKKELEQYRQKVSKMTACKDHLAPIYALRQVNDSLKNTLAKHTEDMKILKKACKQRESDLLREISDLNMRIQMCRGEYKILLQNNHKLEKTMAKEKGLTKRTKSEASQSSSPVMVESLQQSAESAKPRYKDEMTELQVKVQNYRERIKDLTRLYQEERERCIQQKLHHEQEMHRKDAECDRLQKAHDEHEHKITSLKKFLLEKDNIIAELNQQKVWQSQKDSYRPHLSRNSSSSVLELNSKNCDSPGARSLQDESTSCLKPVTKSANEDLQEDGAACSPMLKMPDMCRSIYPNPYLPAGSVPYPQLPSFPRPLVYPHPSPQVILPPKKSIPRSFSCDATSIPIPLGIKGNEMRDIIPLGYQNDPLSPPGDLPRPLTPVRVDPTWVPRKPEFCSTQDDKEVLAPTAPFDAEEDRFVDACGEAMKICPQCKASFHYDATDSEFVEHYMGHFGEFCPICKIQRDETLSMNDFECHVLLCLEKASKK